MAGSTVSSDISRPGVDLPESPQRGQIWAAQLSAVLPVLQAAEACSAAGLSVAMQTDKDKLEKAGSSLPMRPCLILRSNEIAMTATVVVFTTLDHGLTDIGEMNQYFQHFAISVGNTPPWPLQTSWTLPIEPCWRTDPQYLTAWAQTIPFSSLRRRYQTGDQFYHCEERSLLKLERLCALKSASMSAKRRPERKQLDKSYVASQELYRIAKQTSSNGLRTHRRAASEQQHRSLALRVPLSLAPTKHVGNQLQSPNRARAFPPMPVPPLSPRSPRVAQSPACPTSPRAARGHRRTQSVEPVSLVPPNHWAILPIDEDSDASLPSLATHPVLHEPSAVLTPDPPAAVPSLSTTPDSSLCDSSPRDPPRSIESPQTSTQPLLGIDSSLSDSDNPKSLNNQAGHDELGKSEMTIDEEEAWSVVRRKSQGGGRELGGLPTFAAGDFFRGAVLYNLSNPFTRRSAQWDLHRSSGATLLTSPRTVI